jgi:hypothetical protein
MLSSISPVGEASRRQRYSVTATAYVLGSLAGGAAMGAVLGAAGALAAWAIGGWSTAQGLLVLALAAALGLVSDLGPARLALPSWRRQVDERWLTTYRGWVYGAGYGLQLGAGWMTIVASSTTYVAGLAALMTASPSAGALVGVVFGGVRALPLLLTARTRSPAALTSLMRRMTEASGTARALAATGQAMLAVAALAVVVA